MYETDLFELVRIYEGDRSTVYTRLEFSSDNTSQLVAMTAQGFTTSFLLKGYNPPKGQKRSPYVTKQQSKLAMIEDDPLILIPFYNLNFSHFLREGDPASELEGLSVQYRISSFALNPAVSVTAFQHSLVVASNNGLIMKWNANVSLDKMRHISKPN